jgi:Uncharacterized conserved protein
LTTDTINLIKLCVGIDSVEHLLTYRAAQSQQAKRDGLDDLTRHITRMWPKRAAEILNGGSLYWVIRGTILARQKILGFEEKIGADGIRRCVILMSPEIIRTRAASRRPFQGWRYLPLADSPPDLDKTRINDDELPIDMRLALAEIGLK